MVTDLDELKDQLNDTPTSEEVSKMLTRHRSRTSESHSENNSLGNGSLQRQKSHENSLQKSSTTKAAENGPKSVKQGQKLIGTEKAETGHVTWAVYKHYLKSMGVFLAFISLLFGLIYQGFSIGSNVWLGTWADDTETYVNGTVDTAKRDMYLGVYAGLGIGQGKCF